MRYVVQMPLDRVQPGLILAYDLLDAGGKQLLPKGFGLTEDSLDMLYRKGIKRIDVFKEENLTPQQIDDKRKELEQQLEYRFRNVGNDSCMQHLKDILLAYRLESLGLDASE